MLRFPEVMNRQEMNGGKREIPTNANNAQSMNKPPARNEYPKKIKPDQNAVSMSKSSKIL